MKKFFAAIALVAVIGAPLTGCTAQTTQATFQPGTALTIGEQAALENLNSGVAASLASANSAADLAALTMPSFYGHAADGTLVANADFGTVTRVNGTTVKYELTGKAKWSDGKPVDANDLKLSVLAATTGFDSNTLTGFQSRLHNTSLAQVSSASANGNSLVLKYASVPADWQTNLPITAAAHVVAPDGLATAQQIAAAGTAYSELTAFERNGVAQNVKLRDFPTAGAYLIQKATSGSVSLVHNPDFDWGQGATIDKVTLKFFDGANALLKAVKAGSVDLAAPQDTASTSLSQITQALGSAKGSVTKGVGPFNELMVLNQGSGATFAASTYNGDAKKAALLGSAFMHYLPRSGIYSTLLSGSALTKTDSFAFATGSSNYNSSVEQNGTSAYQFQNQELAQEKWQKAGFARKLVVRVLFDSNNPRGQLEYAQLAQWGKVSGFNIQNVSSANVNQVLLTGGWDLYIGSFPRLDQSLSAVAQVSGALNGVSNAKLRAAVAPFAKEPDIGKSAAALSKLDQQLVASYAGLPLFELPSVIFTGKKLSKYQPSLALQQLTWGYPFWSVSASSK